MVTSSLILMVIFFNRKIPVIMARTMWAPGMLWASGIRLKIEGKDRFDRNSSYIFASNHLSYLDIPVLFRAIPVNLYFIAKKEVKKIPFIGWYMMATGMIFIDRKNRDKAIQSLERAGNLIKGGKNVLVFPEGTRSKDGEVMALKKGSFMLAAQADINVVPVAIHGTRSVLPPDTFKLKPGVVHVNIGAPVPPHNETEKMEDFIGQVRTNLIGLKEELSQA